MTNLLSASSRVAFAALIHDLGKFAERAKILAYSRRFLRYSRKQAAKLLRGRSFQVS